MSQKSDKIEKKKFSDIFNGHFYFFNEQFKTINWYLKSWTRSRLRQRKLSGNRRRGRNCQTYRQIPAHFPLGRPGWIKQTVLDFIHGYAVAVSSNSIPDLLYDCTMRRGFMHSVCNVTNARSSRQRKRNGETRQETSRREEKEKEDGRKRKGRTWDENSRNSWFGDQLTNRLTCRVTTSIENYLTGTRCLVTVELRRNEIVVRRCSGEYARYVRVPWRASLHRANFQWKTAIMVGRVIYRAPGIFVPTGSFLRGRKIIHVATPMFSRYILTIYIYMYK